MLQSFFRTAFRNIWKNKIFSFLNIGGLAVGIASAALIFLWVKDELTYNSSFEKKEQLYRIMENFTLDGKVSTWKGSPEPLAAAIKNEIPGVRRTARMNMESKNLFSLGDKSIPEEGNYADSAILSMLSLQFVKGGAAHAFQQVNAIIINESMAGKFFGSDEPLGKVLRMNNEQEFTITGVFKDLPDNSSFQFQWLAPFEAFEARNQWIKQKWGIHTIQTFVETETAADVAQINKKLYSYLMDKQTNTVHPFLFAMNDWRLRDNFVDGQQKGGRIQYVHLFTIIAWMLLLIACINFMNLSTARSEQRAKEIGVRKVAGARRGGLISQFIGEALLVAYLSALLTLLMVWLALPGFNTLVGKQLSLHIFDPLHIGSLLGIALFCGLVAGSYPAFYLSSFNPINALKGGRLKTGMSAGYIRRGLVIFQFSISIILMIGTMVVFQQIRHAEVRNLGYNKNDMLYIDLQDNLSGHFQAIRDRLLSTGMVENACLSSDQLLEMNNQTTEFGWQGKDINRKTLISMQFVSPQFISTMGMRLKEGRDFYADARTDSNSVIISESMAALMGDEGKPGRQIVTYNALRLRIVGIISDFVYNDIYTTNRPPVVIFCNPQETRFLNIKFHPGVDLQKAVTQIASIVTPYNPGHPFEYKFFDEQFDQLFKTEKVIGKLAGIFAALSIVISCLGLFGLAVYSAERRTKEIGIRKVLGASVFGLVQLLSKDFLRLVAIAYIIAFPVAWWAMHNWLQHFEYRTALHWWVFVIAGAGALLIALFTVSFQALKAAGVNPLRSLRTE